MCGQLFKFIVAFLIGCLFLTGCRHSSPEAESQVGSTSSSADTSRSPSTVKLPGVTSVDRDDLGIGLTVGDQAPSVDLAQWVKGTPFLSFEPGHVYVVEFWATWCPPCRDGMPHISELQELHEGQVTFVGITNEDLETVETFLASKRPDESTWDETVRYALALDTSTRATSQAYMTAAGQSGIPCAFVVGKTGLVEWIGHPAVIDDVLQAIVDDAWNREAFQEEFAPRQLRNAIMTQAARFAQQQKYAEANQALQKLAALDDDDPNVLSMVARTMAGRIPEEGRDLEAAAALAHRAVELSEENDPIAIDTLAVILHLQGDLDGAIAWQTIAVSLKDRSDLRQRLNAYLLERDGPDESAEGEDAEASDDDES